MDELEEMLSSKALDQMNAMSGKKRRSCNIPKLDDAHDAGTTRSGDTILYLTEGDSAATMVRYPLIVISH